MSFGFSIGDIAAASTFAWRIYKSCKDSSDDFISIASDVANLHVALRETEDYCQDQQLTVESRDRLAIAGQNCRSVLEAIDERLEKYRSLGTSSQRTWDRLRWGMDDAAVLKDRLASTTNALTVLNTSLANSTQARIENKLNQLLEEIRQGKRERSLLSVSTIQSLSTDDKEAYEELKKDLEDVGIDVSLFMQHRKFIAGWFCTAIESGLLGPDSSAEGTIAARSLSTLIEAGHDMPLTTNKGDGTADDPRLSTTTTKLLSNADQISDSLHYEISPTQPELQKSTTTDSFPRILPHTPPVEISKKRGVFKRALKGISTRISFRDGLESPLRTPRSPKSGPQSAKLYPQEALSLPLPPPPPIPQSQMDIFKKFQKRNRSNTARTMVTRLSNSGGEIDLSSGYSVRQKPVDVSRRSQPSLLPRPYSENVAERTSKLLPTESRLDKPTRRLSRDPYEASHYPQHAREPTSSTNRRRSESFSEHSTRRSSRTSSALSPYERETFERHNATMKAYFERRPAWEAKMDAARRSLQLGIKPIDRAPPLPFNQLVVSGMEGQPPPPPPKDKRETRRHTQPIPQTTSMKGLEPMPSVSSLSSDSNMSQTTESGLLTVMLQPDLFPAPERGQTWEPARIAASEEQYMMNELTGPLRRFSINACQENGDTYLLKAASNGFPKAVVYLLQNGANVLMTNSLGQDALHAAVASNQPETMQAILDAIPANSIPDLWQTTILHTAVELGSEEMVEALLLNGADTSYRNQDDLTAYDIASQKELEEICRILQGGDKTPPTGEVDEENLEDRSSEVEATEDSVQAEPA